VNNSLHHLIIDGHVHLYQCFNITDTLDAAYSNISREARRLGCEGSFTGVLMLTERATDHYYHILEEMAVDDKNNCSGNIEQWWFRCYVEEKGTLLACRKTGEELIIIAGRQIATQEGIEVLALATTEQFKDGHPINHVVDQVRHSGGIPVIPWAVGKWWGRRGGIIDTVIKNNVNAGVLLGDNGGRPVFWRNPRHFIRARELDLKILPGSDPLPLPDEANRVGSYGFIINHKLSGLHPSNDLKQLLLDSRTNIKCYGDLQKISRFFRNQLGIRFQNRCG
jgi:hypothetical protein